MRGQDEKRPNWGGHRKGAGRPPIDATKRIKVSVAIPQDIIERIDALALLDNTSRSQFIANVLRRELALPSD